MKKFEKVSFAIIAVIAVVGMILAFVDPIFFETVYCREDGIIESSTALFLLLGSLLSLKRVWNLRQSRSKLFLAVTLACAAVFLFGAGEEISWGQRIFNIRTPVALEKMNAQGELNLHNLTVNGVKLNKLIFSQLLGLALFIYLLAIPFYYQRKEKLRTWCQRLAIPVAKNHQIRFYFIFSIFISLIPQQRKWEVLEFAGCYMFFLILLYPRNSEIFDPKK